MNEPALDAQFRPLAVQPESQPPAPQLLDALRPAERVALMAEISGVVADVIKKQGWFVDIKGKKHITIHGWTFVGSLAGCSVKTTGYEKIDGGYKAHASVVRVDSGIEVGSAEQVCMKTESFGRGKDDYALIGMASTRACSRALSTTFRHVVELAGYSATPAEEMNHDDKPFGSAGAAVAPRPTGGPSPTLREVLAPKAQKRAQEPAGEAESPEAIQEALGRQKRALRTRIMVNARVLWPKKDELDEKFHQAARLHRIDSLKDAVIDGIPLDALESLSRDLQRRAEGIEDDEAEAALLQYAERKIII